MVAATIYPTRNYPCLSQTLPWPPRPPMVPQGGPGKFPWRPRFSLLEVPVGFTVRFWRYFRWTPDVKLCKFTQGFPRAPRGSSVFPPTPLPAQIPPPLGSGGGGMIRAPRGPPALTPPWYPRPWGPGAVRSNTILVHHRHARHLEHVRWERLPYQIRRE